MKIANIDREFLHIFWATWGISMKFSEKMWIMIILKVTKNQGFSLSLEDTFFKKLQGAVLGLIQHKLRGPFNPSACGPNMDLVLSKREKDAFTVLTSFQKKYLKANSKKSHLLTRSDNVLHINIRGDQFSSRKYEELLGMLSGYSKITF